MKLTYRLFHNFQESKSNASNQLGEKLEKLHVATEKESVNKVIDKYIERYYVKQKDFKLKLF